MKSPHAFIFRGVTIPLNVADSLKHWIENGRPTGDFLRAVLENDLKNAIWRADANSLEALPTIVSYLHWEAPSLCHGSLARVTEWPDVLEAMKTADAAPSDAL